MRRHIDSLTCQIRTRKLATARSIGNGSNNGCVCTFACIGTSTFGSTTGCGCVRLKLTVLCVSRDANTPKRRTAVLDTNKVHAAAEDSGIGVVPPQAGRGEGALLAEGARLDIGSLDDLVLVGRIDGGGHGGVGILGDHYGEGRGERYRGDSELHDLR